MALLDISKLTIRFGGLCAVNEVDLVVPEGAIVSVIGPNGAGKTTVFNGVTALYEPTGGRITCRGSDMKLPLRARTIVAAVLVGLATAATAAFLSVNVDQLWKVTLKQNYLDPSRGFPFAKAGADFGRYLAGETRLEERGHRWHVVNYNSERSLASSPDREVAAAKFAAIREMIALGGSDATVLERQGAWVVLSPDGARTLAAFDSRAEAVDRLATLAEVGREARRVHVRFELAAVLGFLVGTTGALSVWRQSRRTPHIVAGHGLARTFQNIRLFHEMSVVDNVLVGMHRHLRARGRRIRRFAAPLALALSFLALALAEREGTLPDGARVGWAALTTAGVVAWVAWVGRRGSLSVEEAGIERDARVRARELLAFVGLAERAGEIAKNLPYGDQRRLEIARALATRPALLLLDEPAAGMNPAETGELMRLIRRIRDTGVTVLLIEHHMKVVMGISDRIAVLDYGIKIAEGTPDEVRRDPRVIEAYLGKEEVG